MNRGDIYWANLTPTQGSEINKRRPCVLVGATPINKARRTVVVVPLSSSASPFPPLAVSVLCNQQQVVAVCDQIRAIDKSRLDELIGSLSDDDLNLLEQGLRQVLVL
jgi:mRNA interferase MazF